MFYTFKGTNPISLTEYKELKGKFPAYASAKVCTKALERGVEKDLCGMGAFLTRCAYRFDEKTGEPDDDVDCMAFVDEFGEVDGAEVEWCIWGVRPSVIIEYDPNSKVVASLKEKEKTALIFDEETEQIKKVTSVAPIVRFGKKEYIWMNEEACETGVSPTMSLISVKILDGYVAVEDPMVDIYGELEELQDACYDAVTEYCTPEEKASIVKVGMRGEDNFERATPLNLESSKQKTDPDGDGK